MISLFFPNVEALRVALVSGIVPLDVARAPATASFDKQGGIWLSARSDLHGEASAALNRLGAKAYGSHSDEATQEYPCWAALIPLRRHDEHAAVETALFAMPTERLSHFLAALDRLSSLPVRYRILDHSSVVIVERPPQYLLSLAEAPEELISLFRPLARNTWRLAGYTLDGLPAKLLDTDGLTLAAPERVWRCFPEGECYTLPRSLPLGSSPVPSPASSRAEVCIPVPLRLLRAPAGQSADGKLWIAPGDWRAFAGHFRDWDERTLRRLEIAVANAPDGTSRTLIRMVRNARISPVFAPPFRAFVLASDSTRLLIPSGCRLVPLPRAETLHRILGADREGIAWMEQLGDSFALYRTKQTAFRPLANSVIYSAPAAAELHPPEDTLAIFALPGFVVIPEMKQPVDSGVPPLQPKPQREKKARPTTGFLQRLSGRIFASRKERVSKTVSSSANSDSPDSVPPPPNEWAARRRELERTILAMPPDVAEPIRAQAWRGLAELAAAMGHAADAALAWIQAIWNQPSPPAEWVEAWFKVELKHGKVPGDPTDAELLARKPSAGLSRILAVRLVARAHSESHRRGGRESLEMIGTVERFADDLPVRLVWLARTAAAQLAEGDALGLARCRDRLFARTAEGGPALDLDAPTFLRFQGSVGAERFHATADWLRRTRESVHRWLKMLGSPGRLQWSGLEADIPSTRAYADLIFACGMAKLGDRGKCLEWQEQAAAVLAKAEGPGVEPAVHKYLLERFRQRIRSGDFGEETTGRTSPPEFTQAELSLFAVEKLQAYLGVFDSFGIRDPYGYRGLQSLIPVAEYGSETPDVQRLLAEAANDRTAGNLSPRILLALEFARTSEETAETLAMLPLALELLPLALRGIGIAGADVGVARRGIRAVELASKNAVKHRHADAFTRLCTTMLRAPENGGIGFPEILAKTAGAVFTACRALGLGGVTSELLEELSRRAVAPLVEQLPLAIGWFALGEDERGMRLLNDARRALFETGQVAEKERGNLALAYARALAHAPAALASGRLEELFQRLDRVTVDGAASRYYALKPLEIIDAAVAAVVTDEFALGPAAKVWLAEDEYRIRQKIVRDLDLALEADTRIATAP